jgi:ATP-dependent RNA helicase DDX5/DBP2
MLDMGFEPQIRKILGNMSRQRQTFMFTATWPKSVRKLAWEFMRQPYTVTIGNRDELKGNQDICQIIQTCKSNEKNQVLINILRQAGVADRSNSAAKGLIFCSTKKMCDQLSQQLERMSVPCAAIHGDKDQRAREAALNGLKDGNVKLLVATDVAARGLDVKGVTLVVNYDPAGNTEDYVHRIGRTGRAGQKGHAIALISERDTHALYGMIQVMRRTNQQITPELEQLANAAPRQQKGSSRGPPPVTIDPNFRSGIVSGGVGGEGGLAEIKAPDAPDDGVVAQGLAPSSKGKGKGKGKGKRDDDFGSRDFAQSDGDRAGDWAAKASWADSGSRGGDGGRSGDYSGSRGGGGDSGSRNVSPPGRGGRDRRDEKRSRSRSRKRSASRRRGRRSPSVKRRGRSRSRSAKKQRARSDSVQVVKESGDKTQKKRSPSAKRQRAKSPSVVKQRAESSGSGKMRRRKKSKGRRKKKRSSSSSS